MCGLDALVPRLLAQGRRVDTQQAMVGARIWKLSIFPAPSESVVASESPAPWLSRRSRTAWPGVSRQPKDGGLGLLDFKWKYGWMHEQRSLHGGRSAASQAPTTTDLQRAVPFSSISFCRFSHDELCTEKSLLDKMPVTQLAKSWRLASYFSYVDASGQKLLFHGL